jgi:tetratricopeptide (TPR) repeat protein
MTAPIRRLLVALAACALMGATRPPQTPAASPPDPAGDLVRQAQQKQREGHPDEALALYRQAVKTSPKSFAANHQLGIALDLQGEYTEAQQHFAQAIQVADSAKQKDQAERSMAISYAFVNDCANAARHELHVHESYLAEKDFYNAGEIANELARICLEAGKPDEALKWYRTGWETGLREPDIKPERKDLWDFRWEHAQARVAARRGNKAEAQKHVDAAKAILDKGTNPTQEPFFPYLVGYVAFYGGEYKTALTELQKANQGDPFILVLIGETLEKLGDKAQAADYYRKALSASSGHNPPNAFARPLARKKLS